MGALGQGTIGAVLARLKALGATVDVTVGATTVTGLMDHQAQELFAGEVPGLTGDERSVFVPTGSLPGLANGVALTVGAESCKAFRVLPAQDEAFVQVVLAK